MKTFIYIMLISVLSINTLSAQDVTFTFANAEITNDGSDDYYEADIMIASTENFYVGSGQLYIEYNTDAFGESIANTTAFEYGRPVGSILGQTFFGGFVAGYSDFVEQNNTASRVSVSFQQNASLDIFTTQGGILTTATPKVLMHIKLKYADVNEDPGICFFYDDGLFQDQFITAAGVQLVNDTYDCAGAALSTSTAYVYNNGWTPSDPSGVSTSTSSIEIVAGEASISSNTIADNVVVRAGAGLSVNTGVTLETISGLGIESSSTSYGSLISDGTIIGTTHYLRHVNQTASSGGNDLITPPLSGQSFTDFLANNSNIVSNANNSLYLFGPFDKTSGSYLTYANTETATLNAGLGYRAATTDNSTLQFTGTVNQGDVNQAVFNSGPAFRNWNLIGNPYPSYLNVQDFLSNTNNISVLDANTVGIYGYDGDASDGWVIYNLNTTDANTVIAPGQGFFVAVENTASIDFTSDMRVHGTSDDFIAGRTTNANQHLRLELSTSNKTSSTDFYFNDNSTEGLDPGYDATVFGGTANSFSIYSHLLVEHTGLDFAIQSLAPETLSDGMIPLGINAAAGEQLTIRIVETSLPEDTMVYLIDTEENQTIDLSTSDYVITPIEDLNGTGRFYLGFNQQTLGIEETDLSQLKVYTLQNQRQLVIKGIVEEPTQARLYDINGRQVLSKVLEVISNYYTIDTGMLHSGVYMLQLSNSVKDYTKKIIID